MMKVKKRTSFNDGVLYIVEQVNENTSFNAQMNATKKSDVQRIKKLCYKTETIRQQDFEFVSQMGSSLSLKVKTRLDKSVTTLQKVVIGNVLYDIIQLDPDMANRELYFYLEKERVLDEK